MCDQNEERAKFQQCLQSSLIAYGSNGAVVFEFIKDFKSDWQKDVYDITRKLGYSEDLDGLIALMKSFPNDVIVDQMPSGLVRFKPVPNKETIDNLNLIDKSNKEIAENRERKARMYQRQNPISFRLSSMPPQGYPHPMFNQSQPIPLSHNIQHVPPHLIRQGQHAPPPYHRAFMSSKPRVKQPISENANLTDLGIRYPQSQLQNDVSESNGTALINGKENRSRNGHSSPPSFSRATTPRVISHHSSTNDLTELEQDEKEFLMQIGKGRPILGSSYETGRPILGSSYEPHFPEDNDYFTEDFRTPASDESTLTGASTRVGSVSSLTELLDSHLQSGTVLDNEKDESEIEDFDVFDDDDDDESVVSDESDCVCFDEDDELTTVNDDPSDCKYFDRPKNEFQMPQFDLSRLIYLFQSNNGSWSSTKIDDLKRFYEQEFGNALSSKELNRLLGSPSNLRIVCESFKQASYPASSFFRVIQSESSSNLYTIKLRRCLAVEFIDPTIYFAKLPSKVVSLPNKKSISNRTPTPTSSINLNNVPSNSSNIQTVNKQADKHVSSMTLLDNSKPSSSQSAKPLEKIPVLKLDFLQIASTLLTILDKNTNGKVLLNDVFKQLNSTNVFSLLKTKIELLGYINEFLSEICQISIEAEEVFLLDVRKKPKFIKHKSISNYASFNGFHSGNKLRVKLLSIMGNGDAKLELCQLSAKLRRLLSDYSDLLEILNEKPTEYLTKNSKKLVFFYDRSKRLRRGYIKNIESSKSVAIKDLDTLDTDPFVVPNESVFDVPENFPMWRFPPCQFSAKIVDADMIQIRRFWKEGTEFSVIITEIVNGQRCFCRPFGNDLTDVDF